MSERYPSACKPALVCLLHCFVELFSLLCLDCEYTFNMSTNNSNEVYVEFSSSLPVWRHFKKAVNNLTAQCKLCKAILKTTSNSTKGLHVHMKSIHQIDTKTSNTAVRRTPVTLELDSASLPSSSSESTSTSENPTSYPTSVVFSLVLSHHNHN